MTKLPSLSSLLIATSHSACAWQQRYLYTGKFVTAASDLHVFHSQAYCSLHSKPQQLHVWGAVCKNIDFVTPRF